MSQEDYGELVAQNVRRFRLERALSMGDLARRAGLSKQTLSKIELGDGNPTVETLAAIGRGLDVSVRRLLTQWGTPVFVQRASEGIWTAGGAWDERVLDEVYGSGYVRTALLRLERSETGGAESGIDGHSLGTLHHVYVVSGRLRTGPVTDPVELSAGDFARFPGDAPHLFTCLSNRVSAHVVTTVPQLRQMRPVTPPADQTESGAPRHR